MLLGGGRRDEWLTMLTSKDFIQLGHPRHLKSSCDSAEDLAPILLEEIGSPVELYVDTALPLVRIKIFP